MILLLKETKFVLLNMTTKNTRSEFCTSPVACQGREERCQARWEGVGFLNPLAEFFKSGGDPIYVRGSSLPLLCNISLVFWRCSFHLVGRLTRWEGKRMNKESGERWEGHRQVPRLTCIWKWVEVHKKKGEGDKTNLKIMYCGFVSGTSVLIWSSLYLTITIFATKATLYKVPGDILVFISPVFYLDLYYRPICNPPGQPCPQCQTVPSYPPACPSPFSWLPPLSSSSHSSSVDSSSGICICISSPYWIALFLYYL